TVELATIVDYNFSAPSAVLEGSTNATPVIYRRYTSTLPTGFTSPNMTADGRYQRLVIWKGNAAVMGGTTPMAVLTEELAPNGFQVKASSANPWGTMGTPFT